MAIIRGEVRRANRRTLAAYGKYDDCHGVPRPAPPRSHGQRQTFVDAIVDNGDAESDENRLIDEKGKIKNFRVIRIGGYRWIVIFASFSGKIAAGSRGGGVGDARAASGAARAPPELPGYGRVSLNGDIFLWGLLESLYSLDVVLQVLHDD